MYPGPRYQRKQRWAAGAGSSHATVETSEPFDTFISATNSSTESTGTTVSTDPKGSL